MTDSFWWFLIGYFSLLGAVLYLAIKTQDFGRKQGRPCTWGQLFRGEPWKEQSNE